jgi:hypothetical protein
MVNHFFLSTAEYNERLVEVLVEKVLGNMMQESSALEIAKDMWKCSSGVFCLGEKAALDNLWANCLLRKIPRRHEVVTEGR